MIPKYVTEFFIGILEIDSTQQSFIANSSHFLRFKRRPDTLENCSKTSIAKDSWELSFKNRVVSSASWLIKTFISAIKIPCSLLHLIWSHKSWAASKSRYGDVGQPCQTPRLTVNLRD